MHDLVTLTELSKRLGMPYTSVRRYVIESGIHTQRTGNYIFVDPEAARAAMPKHRTSNARNARKA